MSRMKGAPWYFKADAGDDVNDGGIPERADAHPPDPTVEIPPRNNERRMCTRRVDAEKYSPTKGCADCQKSHLDNCALMHRGHTQ